MRTPIRKISKFCGVVGFLTIAGLAADAYAGDAGETPAERIVIPSVYERVLVAEVDLGSALDVEAPRSDVPVLLAQTADEDDLNDPLETVNRAIFAFNQVVYDALLTPVAKAYNASLPAPVRSSVSNVIDHVASPVTLANDLLQFEIDRAMTTIARFLVNTIIGFGGLDDVAASIGLEEHSEDFGQTLGSYGMGEGFYLVLPLLGPSNPRDAIGKYLVDPYFDPLGMWLDNTDRDTEAYVRMGVSAVDEYASIVDSMEKIRKTSIDYYAAIRSLYRQKRATEISNGHDDAMPAIPNYDINFMPDSDGSIANVK